MVIVKKMIISRTAVMTMRVTATVVAVKMIQMVPAVRMIATTAIMMIIAAWVPISTYLV